MSSSVGLLQGDLVPLGGQRRAERLKLDHKLTAGTKMSERRFQEARNTSYEIWRLFKEQEGSSCLFGSSLYSIFRLALQKPSMCPVPMWG